MRYFKAFIVGLLALVAVVFVIENIKILQTSIQLRLKLFFIPELTTPELELWVLTILSFALGAILVLIYFVFDHIKQRQTIRQLRQNIEIMNVELKRAGLASEEAAAGGAVPPEQHEL